MAPKPSAANAVALELVKMRLGPLPLCNVMAPPLMVEALVVPEIESILASSA